MIIPLTNDSILVLNSFYVLFIVVGFFTIAIEQLITLIQRARHG